MANFFDQFDGGDATAPSSGRLRITVTPPQNDVSPVQTATNFFSERGYSPQAVSGIVGNLLHESGMNPAQSHDGGSGIGIAGWRLDRRNALRNFAQQRGATETDLNTQLEFLDHELRTSEQRAMRGLSSARTPDEAAAAFLHFERPLNYSADNPSQSHGYANRVNKARNVAEQFNELSAKAKTGPNFFDQFDGAPATEQAPASPAIAPAPSATPTPAQSPAAPQISRTESAASGAAQGVTLNFYDELRGLMEAGGLDPKDPASLTALLQGAYRYFSGDPAAAAKYDATSARERDAAKAAATANPGASLLGNIAGGIALPIGAVGQAATLPGRMATGAVAGAAMGAGYGAGEGVGLEDRATRALGGAAIGGAVGGAAPAVLEGVSRGVKAVAQPVINTVRGLRNPEGEASRRVMTALQRDAQNGSAGLTPTEMIAARSRGEPVANMDMGGEMTRALGRSAANTSPDARAALERTINDRFEGQSGRAIDAVRALVATPGQAGKTREALMAAADKSRAPFYQRAFREGANGIWDSEMQTLSQAPVMQKAIREATASIQNKAASGRAMSPVSPSGSPTLEFWDQVKRNLDSAFSVARRAGDRETAADVQAIKAALVEKLDNAVPSYATARGVAAELFKANDALDAGEKFVTSSLKNSEVAKAVAKMTPEERALFAEGFVSKTIEKLGEIGDRRNIIAQLNKSPAARERMTIALGQNAVNKLDTFMARESIMDRWRNAIQGNSTTARQLVEAGLAGGAYGAYSGNWDMNTLMVGALTFGARRGQMKIDQGVARRVGEMLASNDPTVLAKGLNIVAGNKQLSRALRNAEDAVIAITSQQSPKTGVLPAIQLPAMGRADSQNDQPAVPRPPG